MSDLSFGDGAHRLSASLDVTAFKGSMQADIEANLSPCLPASMDGTIGRGVKSADIVNGDLVLTFTDGKTLNLGPVVGSNGEDGYSPSTSITNIPGGHRVTITDADGETKEIEPEVLDPEPVPAEQVKDKDPLNDGNKEKGGTTGEG